MSDFNAKMHQSRFRLGLRLRPRWGSLQRSPGPLAGFKGLLLRGEEVMAEKGWERRGGEGGGARPVCLPPRFDNPGYGPESCILNRKYGYEL